MHRQQREVSLDVPVEPRCEQAGRARAANLVRFAIGVEDTADLIADVSRALGALR